MSTEAEIRQRFIDKRLAEAGWSREKGNLATELSLRKKSIHVYESGEKYSVRSSKEQRFADYVLLDEHGDPLAIVEAKRESRSPLEGMEQAAEYAELIYEQTGKRPSIFLSNGDEIYFWEPDLYPPRLVSGFYTAQDLANLEKLRLYSQQLHLFEPKTAIVDRGYQRRAIQTVLDSIKQKRRKFLLVMATGTGKTRTVIALVDLLFRAGWVRRVLFLADRRELVKQASEAFESYIPHESRVRIEGGAPPSSGRIHFATYPSMMQVFSQLSVGYYDLIIADESHRSIYHRYREIFAHFDALQVGLTATPTDYIEHNTYQLFDCVNDRPSFEYPFDVAVENDYLVNFRVLAAQTHFQIEGIKAGELPPEFQRQIVEQGLDLNEINFEGSDLERKVTNTRTNDQLVDEFMQTCYHDARGLPHKSIIFAVSHHHALEIQQSFDRLYPDLQSRGMARVIDSHMERAEKMLDDFKSRDMPRVAISVDMLDTGIDVPAIQTLVFAKPVYSQVKFWQMIGRGTRLWTDPVTGERKNDFIIIDHWTNFDKFDKNPEGKVNNPGEPLPVRLFRMRLRKLALVRPLHDTALETETVQQLHSMVKSLPEVNSQVRLWAAYLTKLQADTTWTKQDITTEGELYRFIAPLMVFLPDVHASVMLFELYTEQLLLAYLEGNQIEIDLLQGQIKEDLARLPIDLPEVRAKEEMRTWVESTDFWTHLNPQRILNLQKELAPILRYREVRPPHIIKLFLPDTMQKRRWITYGPAGEGAFVDDYREQLETKVKDLSDQQVPALIKIKQKQQLGDDEVRILEGLLGNTDLFIREEILRQVYQNPSVTLVDFVKHILDVQRLPSKEERVNQAVERFLRDHSRYTSTQRRIIYALRSFLQQNAEEESINITLDVLSQPPFNRIADVKELFHSHELTEILQFVNNQVA
ncbi:MAG: DEAD/DEAH box helicase family protein [Ktedonobacteraceae bacterium]|nr:DEAD/DEAH box helicase family protein [Ktedonobacteraceae bacterium]